MEKIILVFFITVSSIVYSSGVEEWNVPNEWEALYYHGYTKEKVIKKRTLRFLVWNIHKEVNENLWKEEFLKLSEQKDIVLLQEFTTNLKYDQFPSSFGEKGAVFGESFEHKGVRTGNLSLTDYRPNDSYVYHSFDREPIINTPKPILKTVYALKDGRDLVVFNVHGINFKKLEPFERYMKIIARQLLVYQGPVIVAGDFNSWSKRRLNFMKKTLGEFNLKQIKFKNSELIKTWRGNKLDHAFQRGFDVVSAYVPKGIESSDHAPLVFTLKLLPRN